MIKYFKKLHKSSGETLTETLAALLIIVLALTMLAGSIVSAALVNSKTGDMNTEFDTTSNSSSKTVKFSGTDNTTLDETVSVDLYTKENTSANNYYYYSVEDNN